MYRRLAPRPSECTIPCMLARLVPFVSSLMLTLSLSLATATAQDDPRERARAHFQQGVEAYERGDYTAALEAFSEAYRLAPHPVVRVNIANAYERLGRPLEALFHFERFLSEATSAPREQRREIEAAIRRLRGLIGELELHIWPDGARVTIDGSEQRRAPLTEPVRVTSGLHTIVVELEGYESERRPIEVGAGQSVRVEIRLERAQIAAVAVEPTPAAGGPVIASPFDEAEPASAPDEPVASASGGFRITAPAWIAGGITIGAAIGAGVTGGLALASNSEFDSQLATYENPFEDPSVREQARLGALSSADRANTLALVSDVLLVTTIVGAGVTTFFLITTQEGELLDDEVQAMAAPLVGEGLAGVVVMGAF